MSRHFLNWTFEEIGKREDKSLEVQFECYVTPGSRGDYWNPPEPPEVEFSDVQIVSLLDANGEIVVDPSWQPELEVIALRLADEDRDRLVESLGQQVGDYEAAAREEYYERKREQLKGY